MPKHITAEQWARFDQLVGQKGYTISAAAKMCGIGRTAASQHVQNVKRTDDRYSKKRVVPVTSEPPDPLEYQYLGDNAKRALEDFQFFREHYLGREAIPWQIEAAYQVKALVEDEHDEHAVINEPPGSGKSTLFSHDIPTWLICRNRKIRVQIGAKTTRKAKYYTLQIRRTLERPYAPTDAEGCIAMDFGRFKSGSAELWRADEFIVEQVDGYAIDNHEPTVIAISEEMDFIGNRGELIVWDDLVVRQNSFGPASENLQDFWVGTAETRLEPGGCLLLVGQRIGPDDLFHFCETMTLGDLDEDEEENEELPRKYQVIRYPAHFDDACEGDHAKGTAKAWPDGCMLDPSRLGWRKLSGIKANQPDIYEIEYQQREAASGRHLVQRIWLEGGQDAHGEYPGCYDLERDAGRVPEGLEGPVLSILSIDPSPTKWWSAQWWLYESSTETRYLLDLQRAKMSAPDLLDRLADGAYIGLANDWANRARNVGRPITHMIVERSAAQRFLMQYDFFQKWLRKQGIQLVPHDTHSNKTDAQYGVATIGAHYRLGRVRLPYKPGSYGVRVCQPLIDEVTRWPEAATEDCVMAHWFMEWQLPNLTFAQRKRVKARRPSWMRAGE